MYKMTFLCGISLYMLLTCTLYTPAQAQYEDVRCKCVCTIPPPPNGTESSHHSFVGTVHEPSQCTCDHVIEDRIWKKELCVEKSLCNCQWERRNTATIKVVVMLIICVIALLVLYMMFLLCLDPLLSHRLRTATYTQQYDEQDTQSIVPHTPDDARARPGAIINRVKQEVNKVKGEQQKWKGTVKEQRRHIYDQHTMLN